jgi:hypothetical protein
LKGKGEGLAVSGRGGGQRERSGTLEFLAEPLFARGEGCVQEVLNAGKARACMLRETGSAAEGGCREKSQEKHRARDEGVGAMVK